jgi:hypothetical protein
MGRMISRTADSSASLPAGAKARAGQSTKARTSTALSGFASIAWSGRMTITLRRGDLAGKFFAENLPARVADPIPGIMRLLLPAVIVSWVCVALLDASAKAPQASASPDGKRHAEVRGGVSGQALWVDGRRIWPEGKRKASFVGIPRWARGSTGVAVLAEENRVTRLVVVLVGDHEPTALEWQVPPEAMPARWVSWLTPSRVAVGPRELEPKLIASWNTRAE